MRDKPDALQTLRERESGTARPDEAVAACRECDRREN
jgi:hypothetical protein